MLGKVKSFFGIESVKLALEIPDVITEPSGILKGKILLNSMSTQTVKSISIKLIEKYERGRGNNKLINEYTAGELFFDKPFKVDANREQAFEFNLPYEIAQSEMDKIGSSNFLTRTFVKAAKYLHGVRSEFRIEVSAKVQGNAISPIISEVIKIKF
jgi:sporulation-control protein spo0M